MRVVFAGTPEFALPSLDALCASRHEIAAVVTRPDARVGRGRAVAPTPVAERAARDGIEVLKPEKVRDPRFLERLRAIGPDCCPVVAYGALIPRGALDIPRNGWVNLHFSLLPAWRGAAPVQHAVLHGDDVTGATTFQIEEGLDSGPVYGVVTEPIGPHDTAGDVLARLASSGASLLVATLDGIESGGLIPRPQPVAGVSHAPKLTPDDGRVDWTVPALRVDRLVRACTPTPGAWTTFRGARLKLFPGRLGTDGCAGGPVLEPGHLLPERDRVLVGTGTTPVVLGEVQPEGKRRMPAVEWARGVRPGDSDRLN